MDYDCAIVNWLPHISYFVGAMCLLKLSHWMMQQRLSNTTSQWFMLHLIANTITSIFSAYDFATLLFHPLVPLHQQVSSRVPPNVTLALHVYHVLFFNNLTTIDWIHHIVMCTALGMTFHCPNPGMTNYAIFVVNGLPGGIDYLLLLCVKHGQLDRITEKQINSKLNLWIRGPGIVIGAYIVYLQWRYGIINYSLELLSIIIVALYWNAQFFTERVVYNWAKNTGAK